MSLENHPRGIMKTNGYYLAIALLLLMSCDMPSGSGCLPGRDVSGWKFVEMSPQVNTKPVVSCGRTVGFDLDMPDGDHASTMWRIEKSMPDAVGDPLRFSVELESTGAPAFQLRPSIESVARVELAYTEYKPAGYVRAVVPDQVAASPSSIRVLQLVFPMSGPYKGRVSNFDW